MCGHDAAKNGRTNSISVFWRAEATRVFEVVRRLKIYRNPRSSFWENRVEISPVPRVVWRQREFMASSHDAAKNGWTDSISVFGNDPIFHGGPVFSPFAQWGTAGNFAERLFSPRYIAFTSTHTIGSTRTDGRPSPEKIAFKFSPHSRSVRRNRCADDFLSDFRSRAGSKKRTCTRICTRDAYADCDTRAFSRRLECKKNMRIIEDAIAQHWVGLFRT